MKKFIIFCTCAIILFFAGDFLIYRMGWYIDWNPDAPVTTQATVEGKKIYLDQGLYDQASTIYRQLSLHNPEKSVYFAEIIARIDKLKSNQ